MRTTGRVVVSLLTVISMFGPMMVVAAPAALAATCAGGEVTWDDEAGNGLWGSADNWSADALPTSGDDVCIPAAFSVTVNVAAFARNLTAESDLTINSSRTLDISGPSTVGGTFTLHGTLSGSGALTLEGTATWDTGTVSADLTVASGGSLDIAGGISYTKSLLGTLTNNATVTQPGANLTMSDTSHTGAIINNGTWTFNDPANRTNTITSYSPVYRGSFTNNGTLNRTGDPDNAATIGAWADFTNNGTVTTTTGDITIGSVSGISNGADFNADAGTTISLTAKYTSPGPGPGAAVIGDSTITGDGTVSFDNNLFTLDPGASITSTGSSTLISGATIAGTGTFIITGASTWDAGTVSADLTVASGGSLDIAGGISYTKSLLGTLTNNATVTQPGANLTMSDTSHTGAIINNGTWTFNDPANRTNTITSYSPVYRGSFTNNGTLNRTGDPDNAATIGAWADFTNNGTVTTTTGDITIGSVSGISNGADFNADAGTTISLTAKYTSPGPGPGAAVIGDSTITGDGTVSFDNNLFTLDPGASITSTGSSTLISGATIAGTGTFIITGASTWDAGTVSADLTVASGGSLDIAGGISYTKSLLGTLTNNATVTQPGANLTMSDTSHTGAIINNGTWTFNDPANRTNTITSYSPVYRGSFTNNGTLNRTGDPDNAATIGAWADFTNNGTVTTTTGDITIGSAPSHYAGTTFSGGVWEVLGGTALDLPGAITVNDADITLSGDGASIPDLGGIGANAFVSNTGTLNVIDGADFSTKSGFSNSGTLSIGNTDAAATGFLSTFAVSGDFTNTLAGMLEIRIGGSNATSLYGDVAITGAANLGGTLNVTLSNGFEPIVTDGFQILDYATLNGSFTTTGLGPLLTLKVTGNASTPGNHFLNGINKKPTALPGGPYSGPEGGGPIAISGSGTDTDGVIVSYAWSPAALFDDPTSATPNFMDTDDDLDQPIQLTVCDNGALQGAIQECDTQSTTVAVTNVAPTVEASHAPFEITEGDTIPPTELATFHDPGGANEDYTATIHWGNGADVIPNATSPISGSRLYPSSGNYTITVVVTDGDGGIGQDTIEVAVNNESPTITPAGPTVEEGDGTTQLMIASFTDPSAESYYVTMDWGDDTGIDNSVFATPGTSGTVRGYHSYEDNGIYPGSVCLTDDGPKVCEPVWIIVTNVAPTIDIPLDEMEATVGVETAVVGSYFDPGSADTHTVDVDWDDGTTSDDVAVSDGSFSIPHTYSELGAKTVQVCVDDGDLGRNCDVITINVVHDPPEVTVSIPSTMDEGDTIDVDGIVVDGNLDFVAWSHDAGATGSFADPAVEDTTFTALQDGTYLLTLTATDLLGASGSDFGDVVVSNVAPTIDTFDVDTGLEEGSTFHLSAAFSDPGEFDTHSATIDWNFPSTASPVSVNEETNTVSGSHMFPQDGAYDVRLCVSDDDGGIACHPVAEVTVTNANPSIPAVNSGSILEDGSFDLVATFTDAGLEDQHTATIDWENDGTDDLTVDPASSPINTGHVYPTAGTYTVEVCVSDEVSVPQCGYGTVDVDSVNQLPIPDTGGPYNTIEGVPIDLDGSNSTDPNDSIVSYLWSGLGGPITNPTNAVASFDPDDDGTFTMNLEVCDTFDECANADVNVVVGNAQPVLDAIADDSATVGVQYDLTATFTDLGRIDTHTATINWNDPNQVDTATVTQGAGAGSIDASHTFSTPGDYTVEVCVSDESVSPRCDQATITVDTINPPPDAVDDAYTVTEGTGDRVLDVLTNDLDDGPLTITGHTDPATGQVTCSSSECTFNSEVGFNDSVTFDYTISDGENEDTATVTITVEGCADITSAFSESGLVTGQAWIECVDPGSAEAADGSLTPMISPDGTMLHMSSGLAASGHGVPAADANDDLGPQDLDNTSPSIFRGAYDASVVRLDLNIPIGASCLAFDVVFATEEYPDYVNRAYNDGFIAELDDSTWSISNSAITAPNNFAYGADDEPLTVNSPFFTTVTLGDRANTNTGMAYNGSTQVLRVQTPITPGAHSLYLSIFDAGDGVRNSAFVMEDLKAFYAINCSTGATEPPIAVDDGPLTINEDATTNFSILDNDFDPDPGDSIVILGTDEPAHGDVFVSADGTFVTYYPDTNYWGPDSFTYWITDDENASDVLPPKEPSIGTVTIDVIEVNDAPVAWPDSRTGVVAATTIDVLSNDWDVDDVDGDIIWIDSWTQPVLGGTVTCTHTDCTYTPPAGWDGPNRFTYSVVDVRGTPLPTARGGSDTAGVYINSVAQGPTNIPPTVDAGGPYEAVVCETLPCTILDEATASDPDGWIESWQWYVYPDPPGWFVGSNSQTPQFLTTRNGVFYALVIVYDNEGAWDYDRTIISAFEAQVTSPINEGGSATATIDFFNPGGSLQTTIDWGDGSSLEVIPGSIFPVSKAHSYAQDSIYPIEVCITGTTADGDIDVCDDQQSVEVENVLPTVDPGIDRHIASGGFLLQNRMGFSDPGDDAPWTARVYWGDGDDEPLIVDDATKSLSMTAPGHQYAVNGIYTVDICVTDDHGTSCDSFQATVSDNMPPVADPSGPYVFFEGGLDTLDASGSTDTAPGVVTQWGWGAVDPGVTLTNEGTDSPTFSARDEGTYEVSLIVCDDGFACSNIAFVDVEVNNADPVVVAGVDIEIVDGTPLDVAATFTDTGVDDTHTAIIDWGDATSDDPASLTQDSGSGSVDGIHAYTGVGTWTVTVTVTDNDGGSGDHSFEVEVVSGLPQEPTADPAGPYTGYDEGEAIPISGAGSTDPDGTIDVYLWSALIGVFGDTSLAETTFTAPDNDTYDIDLTVTDDDGLMNTVGTTVTTNNVAPIVGGMWWFGPYDEGALIQVLTHLSDPGTADTHTATVNWDDGTVYDLGPVAPPEFMSGHTYADNGYYNVVPCVTDNDGGTGCRTSQFVTINNLPPVVDAGADSTILLGDTYQLMATFTDPGTADTHTAAVDWGDGEITPLDPAISPIQPTHTYLTAAPYTITVTVTDDDGDSHSDTVVVTAIPAIPGCPVGAISWVGGDGDWSAATNWSSNPVLPGPTDDICIPAGVTATVDTDFEVNSMLSLGEVAIGSGAELTLNDTSETSSLSVLGELAGPGELTVVDSGDWSEGRIRGSLRIANTAMFSISSDTRKDLSGALVNEGDVTQNGRLNLYFDATNGLVTNNGTWNLEDGAIFTFETGVGVSEGSIVNNGTIARLAPGEASNPTVNILADVVNNGTITTAGRLWLWSLSEMNNNSVFNADPGGQLTARPSSGFAPTVTGVSSITGDGDIDWHGMDLELAFGSTVEFAGSAVSLQASIAGQGLVSVSGTVAWNSGTISADVEVPNTGILKIRGTNDQVMTGVVTNDGLVLQEDPLALSDGVDSAAITNNSTWRLFEASTGPATYGTFLSGDLTTPATFNNHGSLERVNDRDPLTEVHFDSGVDLISDGVISVNAGTFTMESVTALDGGTLDALTGSTLRLNAKTGIPTRITATTEVIGDGAVELGNDYVLAGDVTGSNTMVFVDSFVWETGAIIGLVEIASGAEMHIDDDDLKYISGTLTNNGVVDHEGSNLIVSIGTDDGTIINNGTWRLTSPTNRTNFTSDVADGTFINNGWLERTNVGGPANFVIMDGVNLVNNDTVRVLAGELRIGSTANLVGTTLTDGRWIADRARLFLPGPVETNDAWTTLGGEGATIPQLSSLTTNADRLEIMHGASLAVAGDFTNNGNLFVGNGAPSGTPSSLEVPGDFTTTFWMRYFIGGPASAGSGGRINVGGHASLGGNLDFILFNGYTPPRTESYQLMSYSSKSGNLLVSDQPPGFDVFTEPTEMWLAENDPNYAYGNVGAGESVGTDTNIDSGNPLAVTVTTPTGGVIEIEEQTPVPTVPPVGYAILGSYYADIAAPMETATDPLLVTFLIDDSVWTSVPFGEITVVRDGLVVAECDTPGSSGPAILDPCVGARTVDGNGDLEIVVRSSEASEWALVYPLVGDLTVEFNGIENVRVDLYADDGIPGTVTGPRLERLTGQNDAAVFLGLPAGSYDLTIKKGARILTVDGTLVAGNTTVTGLVENLTVDLQSLTGVTLKVRTSDGTQTSGSNVETLTGQSGVVTIEVLKGFYELLVKQKKSELIVDPIDCTVPCDAGGITSTLTVDLQNLTGVTLRVRTSDGTQTPGNTVRTLTGQSGVVTIEVVKGTYELLVKHRKAELIVDPIDCTVPCDAGDLTSTLRVDLQSLAGITVETRMSDGSTGTLGAMVQRYKDQAGLVEFDVLKGIYELVVKQKQSQLVIDPLDCTADCTVGDVVSTMTVDLEGLTNIRVQIRTSDSDPATLGSTVASLSGQSGVVTIDVLTGVYELVLKQKQGQLVIDPLDCTADCDPGDVVETLAVDLGTLSNAKVKVRIDDGIPTSAGGGLVMRVTKQSGVIVLDVLRGVWDVKVVSGGNTNVFDSIDCSTGPGSVIVP